MPEETILSRIKSPADLKQLTYPEMTALCGEIREFLIQTVSQTGGHLSSNLGVVELTVALHKVFDTPLDRLVWDVGHQCYPHKLLTGRMEQFHTLRQENGLGGFPRPRANTTPSSRDIAAPLSPPPTAWPRRKPWRERTAMWWRLSVTAP